MYPQHWWKENWEPYWFSFSTGRMLAIQSRTACPCWEVSEASRLAEVKPLGMQRPQLWTQSCPPERNLGRLNKPTSKMALRPDQSCSFARAIIASVSRILIPAYSNPQSVILSRTCPSPAWAILVSQTAAGAGDVWHRPGRGPRVITVVTVACGSGRNTAIKVSDNLLLNKHGGAWVPGLENTDKNLCAIWHPVSILYTQTIKILFIISEFSRSIADRCSWLV